MRRRPQVQETCNFDCLYAYLTCTNYDFRYDMSKGLRPRRQVRQAMAHEISMYGIVQKEKLGFDKAVEDIKYRMSVRGFGSCSNLCTSPFTPDTVRSFSWCVATWTTALPSHAQRARAFPPSIPSPVRLPKGRI